MERGYSILSITPKAQRALSSGHPWVYGDEIIKTVGEYENGDIVDVVSSKGRWLGSGYVNDNSKIRVRIISTNTNDRFDEAFYERRIRYAVEYRKTVMGDDFDCCRLIFGEADMFPGLTVDKFGDILVTEVLSLGTDRIKEMLYRLLVKVLAQYGVNVSAIYERSDSPLRDKEGLEHFCGYVYGSGNGKTEICENGIRYEVDYENGQKTGFFLDQKYNRLAVAKIASGKKVLDCCTHTGAFALNAAKHGAASVTAVDISADAINQAKKNAELNRLDINFVQSDVFALLTELEAKKVKDYDFIILDPPAFTKSGSTVASAYRGYKEINMKAMKILPRGGYLATCSCSHFMTKQLFEKMLTEAAADASVRLKEVEVRKQCCDHPVLWGVPETEYLKFFIFQVI